MTPPQPSPSGSQEPPLQPGAAAPLAVEQGQPPEVLGLVEVSKRFGSEQALEGVSLSVAQGSLTALLGPSGSGKTTLLRLVAGFEAADSGSICLHGECVDGPGVHLAPERRRIGYVPQEGGLFPHLDVRANVAFGLPRRQGKAQRAERVTQLLELTGLSAHARKYPHQLSGGQQQRVALARALAPQPQLVLLDEPFSALDAALRLSLREEVAAIIRRTDTTAVLVTHDQDEALSMADHLVVLAAGRVAQDGTPVEAYARPASEHVAAFVGQANLLTGTVLECDRGGVVVDTPLGAISGRGEIRGLTAGSRVRVMLRPEHLEVGIAADQQLPLRGVVAHLSYHGHEALLRVDTEAAGTLTVRVAAGPGLATGHPVWLGSQGPARVWPSAPSGDDMGGNR